ncbi:MAG: ABC transporter permease [Acidobacteriota bacterium]
MDGWVLLFTLAISVLTGILFGLVPAFHSARRVPYQDLKEGGRTGGEGGASGRVRRVLVVCEVALSLALLAGAGLLLRSFVKVLGVDAGFHSGKVLTMHVALPEKRYSTSEQRQTFYHEILDRIDRLPGVEAAGATVALPISGQGGSGTTTIDTQEVPPDKTFPEADWRPVTPGYFKAIGMTLVRGRFFTDADTSHSAPVAIIDDSLARTFFRHENPIGKRLRLGGSGSKAPWMTIVGVVAHVRYRSLEAPSRVQVYWPEAQMPSGSMSLAIRTSVSPLSLVPAVEKAILSVDPNQPVYDVRTMEQLRSEWLSQRFLSLLLVGLFAGIALALAAVGIYGVMAYSVTRRTHEIGVRMALGAERRDVLRLVIGQGLKLALIGVCVGVAAALALTRFLASLLYGVKPTDPLTFVAVSLVLIAVALAACYIPARRATRVDPMEALRYE